MQVQIGNVTIPDATVKRFIDLDAGFPLSMIRVSYPHGEVEDGGLVEAFKSNIEVSFECEILKTTVFVHGFGGGKGIRHFTLRELATEVSCDYKKVSYEPRVGREKAIVMPQNVKQQFGINPEKLKLLPYVRLILKEDIPEIFFE